MDRIIYIDTTIKSPSTIHGTNSDFIVELDSDMIFPNTGENYLALKYINLNYTWNNIDQAKYNNNSMRYSSDNGSTFKTITFPNGNYSYSDISNFINNYLETQGDSKTGIQLYYVSSLKRIFLELAENFQVDFLSNLSFAKLIGFASSNKIIISSTYSNNTPDITNSIDTIVIHCTLLSDVCYNGNTRSDVLYKFSTSTHRIGYDIPIQEINMEYHKMNDYKIRRFGIKIRDALDRSVDLEDPVSMALCIRSY